MTRFIVHFSGRVQGVGFRYTAREIAARYAVSGFVENLADGRVRLVAEGSQDELHRYLEALGARMCDNIRDRVIATSPATGEFGTPGKDRLTVRR